MVHTDGGPSRTPAIRLLLLALLALAVHGYHLGVDDAEIYVPAIKKIADPALYGFGSQFFMTHANLSFFPNLIGGSARLTHLPVNWTIFLWHVGGIYLLLLASWRLLTLCFEDRRACWGGVALLASLLTVPVAGTALVIMDPYVTARTLSTPLILFAVASVLGGKRVQACFWIAATALLHIQMAVYGAVFLLLLEFMTRKAGKEIGNLQARTSDMEELEFAPARAYSLLPVASLFGFLRRQCVITHGAARQALLSRTYFFLAKWAWYEWIGIFAPLALAWWAASRTLRGSKPILQTLLKTIVLFGGAFTVVGAILSISPQLESLARLQPMRAFHLIYAIFFLIGGALLVEYVLRHHAARWAVVFVPVSLGMMLLQFEAFHSSSHIEWPGAADANPWNTSFVWVRDHTPKDAVFALDPGYLLRPGEDMQGFRAIAERSALADSAKDSGAVSLFPQLAGEWSTELAAERGMARFSKRDFTKLAARYPVTWIVTERPAPTGMLCPYESMQIAVCRIAVQ